MQREKIGIGRFEIVERSRNAAKQSATQGDVSGRQGRFDDGLVGVLILVSTVLAFVVSGYRSLVVWTNVFSPLTNGWQHIP